MPNQQIIYEPGAVARIILNRPEVHNAQSRVLLEEVDHAFASADADPAVRVIVLSGNGPSFSAGHDLGSPAELSDRERRGFPADRAEFYQRWKALYLETTLRWRNILKPTIAMVHGQCIYGGWMVASAMDVIFAADSARFLPAPNAHYFSAPWDLGPRRALELLYVSRFITAQEAKACGFVNQVFAVDDLERETMAYAHEVAENDPATLRRVKLAVLQMLDGMGFTSHINAAFHVSPYGLAAERTAGRAVPARRRMPGVERAMAKRDDPPFEVSEP